MWTFKLLLLNLITVFKPICKFFVLKCLSIFLGITQDSWAICNIHWSTLVTQSIFTDKLIWLKDCHEIFRLICYQTNYNGPNVLTLKRLTLLLKTRGVSHINTRLLGLFIHDYWGVKLSSVGYIFRYECHVIKRLN